MTTRKAQAEALRQFADTLESEELPGSDYHEAPLHVFLFFRTEAERANALDVFRHEGQPIRIEENGHCSASYGGTYQTGGLEVSLAVPSLPNE